MLVGGQHYPKRNPKDCKILSSWISRILLCENSSLPTYRRDGWGPVGERAHRKCYLITEVAEFPLCSEGKCYKSVIALPSMCDLQDLECVSFQGHLFSNTVFLQPGRMCSGRGERTCTSGSCLPQDSGWLGTETTAVLLWPLLIRIEENQQCWILGTSGPSNMLFWFCFLLSALC